MRTTGGVSAGDQSRAWRIKTTRHLCDRIPFVGATYLPPYLWVGGMEFQSHRDKEASWAGLFVVSWSLLECHGTTPVCLSGRQESQGQQGRNTLPLASLPFPFCRVSNLSPLLVLLDSGGAGGTAVRSGEGTDLPGLPSVARLGPTELGLHCLLFVGRTRSKNSVTFWKPPCPPPCFRSSLSPHAVTAR